ETRAPDGRRRFRRLGLSQGLANENVNSLEESNGRIWASTDAGLAVIDPATFVARSLRRAEGVHVSVYWVGSAAKTRQGELLIGGVGGLTVVSPERLAPWNYQPPTVITEVRVGGKQIPSGSLNTAGSLAPLAITPDSNSIAVEFAALDF